MSLTPTSPQRAEVTQRRRRAMRAPRKQMREKTGARARMIHSALTLLNMKWQIAV
jgi:hypothetical protein